ncbi:DNA polymerase III subunit alpha [Alicyclobacillus cycloheptanicus]|uniref:DNA polymerase III subunit alpha n=1 Tax=Alicyclobacillus cycloheptanicus TaxID=1457 RepID=A0ABT9XF19_9BACL|nr:DNA polymerase III subunit alpha [Alicyclobacillus cycloheptanicus]MDQ0188891.1 error-prone DNA polymerase [Alicyclobacillus cycloheptanicus]WDM01754.1 DNA polymerase III subunit alpha [Alicyclobacillus cycloheptanicus]
MFVHLHCHSPFSFLDGASSIESLVAQASMQGMAALALTDHNTIAGLPSFHRWAASYGIKPISGAELTLEDGSHLTVLAETPQGYENLCRLLTIAHEGEVRRRDPRVPDTALLTHTPGLIVLSGCRRGRIVQHLLHGRFEAAKRVACLFRDAFPRSFYIELQGDDYPGTHRLNKRLAELANACGVPIVAAGNVHYATPAQAPVHDILTCMRVGCDIRTPHADRPLNFAQFLFDADEAERRFAPWPRAMANTLLIAQRCQVVLRLDEAAFPTFDLGQMAQLDAAAAGQAVAGRTIAGRTTAGQAAVPPQNTAQFLRDLVYQGAAERYPAVDAALRERLDHELAIIERLGYVDYFLVVWDIVNFARKRHIRCAGRGSAADSAVAYCLYITDVDAAGRGLLFERFMSLERAEKPDIDIDFDSRRRDEVMDYVYRKYGRDHVARVATYQTFRGRSAIREVGKALGMPAQLLDTLAKRVPWGAHADGLEGLFDRVPELKELARFRKQLPWLWKLSAHIAGFPRHFGMHVGGVVISRRPLLQITSLQPSAKGELITPFDKDAVEDVGLVKLDLLSLRTMSAVDDAIRLRARQGEVIDYDRIPLDDAKTFEMLGTGDTIGVFQLESPAQRALQARLHPEGLEDIVASVALIRPGPIKGNMVDPFLERRRGQAAVSYLHPKLEPILGKTYGVVLFQEQVIEIATAIANFTPGEADQLRRVMSHARSAAEMEKIGRKFLEKAAAAGVDPEVAATIFSYIQGYASYGFCEAHAAAFAVTAYKTAYLVKHYPAEFFAAILNQYPMGYYPVHVICAEARRRGIAMLGLDINRSEWGCTVVTGAGTPGAKGAAGAGEAQPQPAIRLGFCLLKGFRQATAEALCTERAAHGPFRSVPDVLRRVPSLDRLMTEHLIRAGAFDTLYAGKRRSLLWELPVWIAERNLPAETLFTQAEADGGPEFSLAERLADEYRLVGVGTTRHWMDLFRPWARAEGYVAAEDVGAFEDGALIAIAGLVVRPHRPPTKSGKTTVFFTVEDETGFVDATMFEAVYHACGAILFTPYGRLVGVEGHVQRRGGGKPQLIVTRVWPLATL